MFSKVLFVALLGLCCASFFENGLKKLAPYRNVQHFAMNNMPKEVNDEVRSKWGGQAQDLLAKIRSSLLLRGAPLGSFRPQQLLPLFGLQHPFSGRTEGSGGPLTLKRYKIDNCSTSAAQKATFVVKQLNVTPDPVVLPGELTFQFDIDVLTDMDDLQASLDFKIKQGGSFIHVPCIDGFGSCDYNVCEMLEAVQSCPQELVDHKIPCHCPYRKNSYVEPGISATIDASVFIPADYNVTATLTSNGNFVGCYTATFTVED